MHATPDNQEISAEPAQPVYQLYIVHFKLHLYFPGGEGGWVISRFKAKSQFKLDLTGTGTELSLARGRVLNASDGLESRPSLVFCLAISHIIGYKACLRPIRGKKMGLFEILFDLKAFLILMVLRNVNIHVISCIKNFPTILACK